MTTEEKAKAYDEALKKAKDMLSYKEVRQEDIEYLFPELAESEDERIRKEIIAFLTYYHTGQGNSVKYDDNWIAWLEKQGEQNPVNEDAEKEKYDYVSGQFLYCKGSFNEFKEGESYWLDYIGNDIYVGRSDNILNQKFHITPRQLYTWLDPRHPEDSNKCEQKSAWSEEDDEMLDSIIEEVCYTGDFPDYPTKEEDELYDECLAKVEWLQSIKDRVQPQQEWSEEDEKKLLCVCAWIKDYPRIADFKDEMYTVANNYINWLKSLRPQKQ